jgi:signal transduction histidine kinase
VLRYLRRVAELPVEPKDQGALSAVVEAAVPTLADEAVLYILAADGCLHRVVAAVRPGPAAEDRPAPYSPISRESSHPAMVAARMGALAYVEDDREQPSVYAGEGDAAGDEDGPEVREVAVPIVREREVVGALHLRMTRARHYLVGDLDPLVTVGKALSLALESSRLRREAREARRAKADFLSVMSHELRTPLTAVVGYADLLEAGIPGPVNESQVGHLSRIKESAWELLEMIDGILGYARYEGQEPELNVTLVRPHDLVDDAIAVYRGSIREKGLDLEVDMPRDLAEFRTDREKASRILLQLLSNAHKFTEEGEVRINVRDTPEQVQFSVQDTGAGIPARDMEHIFEPFWQGQKADTRTAGGTGMGLSLAKRLTELISGELIVESRPGKGTTVRLSLPRQGPQPSFP